MTANNTSTRMRAQIQTWLTNGDRRSIFLQCYAIMTQNMQQAIAANRFHDPLWMDRLVAHFADYYFVALDAYEGAAGPVPAIWQQTFDLARDPAVSVIHNLLLGVNAHINYDLALAVSDMLGPEATTSTPVQWAERRADYDLVNQVIAASIDSVQEQVVDEHLPEMRIVDLALGPLDEHLIARMIVQWRDRVWDNALELVTAGSSDDYEDTRRRIEQETIGFMERLRTGELGVGPLDALLRWLG